MRVDPVAPVPVLIAVAVAAVAVLVLRARRGARFADLARSGVVVALLAVLALDPSWGGAPAERRITDADVFFVVDTTGSIAAEDHDGKPRLDAVKADIMSIAEQFPGARFALVSFDWKSRIDLPLTTDLSALDSLVNVLTQEQSFSSTGSSLDMPLESINQLLRSSDKERTRYLFFMSDGEQTEGDIGSFSAPADRLTGGKMLGYGTEQGGKMRDRYRYGTDVDEDDPDYIMDWDTGKPAISKANPENLKKIASDLGLPFANRTAGQGIGDVTKGVGTGAPTKGDDDDQLVGERHLSWVVAIGLLAVGVWQLASTVDAGAAVRRFRPAEEKEQR